MQKAILSEAGMVLTLINSETASPVLSPEGPIGL